MRNKFRLKFPAIANGIGRPRNIQILRQYKLDTANGYIPTAVPAMRGHGQYFHAALMLMSVGINLIKQHRQRDPFVRADVAQGDVQL